MPAANDLTVSFYICVTGLPPEGLRSMAFFKKEGENQQFLLVPLLHNMSKFTKSKRSNPHTL